MQKVKLRLVQKSAPKTSLGELSYQDYSLLRSFVIDGTTTPQLDFFLEKLHSRKQWVICDCQGPDVAIDQAPALTVAKSPKGRLFIRNLTSRKNHQGHCPFSYTSAPPRDKTEVEKGGPSDLTSKALDLHRVQGEAKGEASETTDSGGARKRNEYPRLGQVMLHLMEQAGMLSQSFNYDYVSGYADLRNAAKKIQAYKNTTLDEVLCLSPKGEEKLKASIRAQRKIVPNAYGLMMVIVQEIDTKTRSFRRVDRNGNLEWICRPQGEVKIWSRRSVNKGPFMVAITFAPNPGEYDIVAQHAFAMPILSGKRPIPVESQLEREVAESLMKLVEWKYKRFSDVINLIKPMYDLDAPAGKCRPDFLLTTNHSKKAIVEVMGMLKDEAYRERKERTIPIMESYAPVHEIAEANGALLKAMNQWVNQILFNQGSALDGAGSVAVI